jgi:tetratricopeptide (TPR) repeat protein
MSKKRILLGALLAVALSAGAVVAVKALPIGPQAPEYPDVPFKPMPAHLFRVIPVKEMNYEEWQTWRRYLAEGGAVQKATAEEREAVKTAHDGKHVRARELAEKILKAQPRSVPALFALAHAQYEGEHNLPRALFLVRKTRKLCEERGRANPGDTDAREWYLRGLYLEYRILQAMDRPEEQLRVVELMEQVYEPMPWLKIWPLFKVKRLDEARQTLETSEKSGRWKLHSLNSRCALEEQCRLREPTYKAGKAMVEAIPHSPVLWSNYGLGCRYTFRLDEAEKAYLKSADLGRPDFNGTAYRSLALLYLQQGRVPESLDALKRAQAQRAERPPHTLQQDETKMDHARGLVLLVLGYGEDAERFVRRAYEQPDRTGSTTDDATDLAISNGLAMWTVLESRQEQLAEEDAALPALRRLAPSADRRALEFQSWTLRRGLLKILHDPQRLAVLRPYMPGTIVPPPWLATGLVRVLPPGVAAEAVRQARAAEDHPGAVPYFDAQEAEVALLGGRNEDALTLARQALAKLPATGEKLLRARAAAVGGEAARRLGRTQEAHELLHQALCDFPGAFRLLGTAVPVRVEHDGSPLARAFAGRVTASPRFTEAADGFRLAVRGGNGKLTVELFRLAGQQHCAASVPARGADNEVIAAAMRRLHNRMMSPALDLTQIDINSLEGSPSALRARQEIDRLLGGQKLPR